MYRGHGQYHKGDSGLDLFCVKDETIPAGETRFVKLGIKASACSEGGENVSWLLMPRSSISKTPLRLCNSVGLIDAGYRGEVMAAVDNVKTADWHIKKGDRIVQAVAFGGGAVHFELVSELDQTTRGAGGFGSTVDTAATAPPATAATPEKRSAADADLETPAKQATPVQQKEEEVSQEHCLLIQPLSDAVAELYGGHGQYHKGDSGLDLFCVQDETIPAGETRFVKLGIKAAAWQAAENVSWLLMPRSSISKTPLRLCNSVGLIDAGYRGEVMAAVDNVKDSDFQLKRGDRIVQAVGFSGKPLSFRVVDSLDKTTRGDGGFGSTAGAGPLDGNPCKLQRVSEANK
uniref:Deoxyuridine 5'-triphosphate nucleotidohydrolase n=1 Tax=Alexandrium catenella TaxID=2925 RepID=A0A7S1WNH0_ALECA